MSKNLVIIILFIFLGRIEPLFSFEVTPKNYIVSSGKAACAIDQESFKCWGEQPPIPKILKKPSNVRLTYFGAGCAVNNQEAVCWNDEGELEEIPSQIVKPTQVIRAYGGYRCALMNGSVKCWSKNTEVYEINVLENVEAIRSQSVSVCAVNSLGIKCWDSPDLVTELDGSTEDRLRFKKKLNNIIQVAGYGSKLCSLRSEEVRCWDSFKDEVINIPNSISANKPRKLAINDHYICTLNDEGVSCWQQPDPPHTREYMKYVGLAGLDDFLKSIKAPRDISMGDDHICVLDHTEVKCLGISVPLAKDGDIKEI
jgi:hypothetical protein